MARIEWAMWANEQGVISCGSKYSLIYEHACLLKACVLLTESQCHIALFLGVEKKCSWVNLFFIH